MSWMTVTFIDYINCECEKFPFQVLTEDQFKCLFIVGLKYPNDFDVCAQLLSKLEKDKNITEKSYCRIQNIFKS